MSSPRWEPSIKRFTKPKDFLACGRFFSSPGSDFFTKLLLFPNSDPEKLNEIYRKTKEWENIEELSIEL